MQRTKNLKLYYIKVDTKIYNPVLKYSLGITFYSFIITVFAIYEYKFVLMYFVISTNMDPAKHEIMNFRSVISNVDC